MHEATLALVLLSLLLFGIGQSLSRRQHATPPPVVEVQEEPAAHVEEVTEEGLWAP